MFKILVNFYKLKNYLTKRINENIINKQLINKYNNIDCLVINENEIRHEMRD